MNSQLNHPLRRAFALAVAFALALPLVSFAAPQGRGRGRGQQKKQEVFVNGHDARDGRLDGRGPRRDRGGRDWDDDDDNYHRGRGHRRDRDRDRDDDGISDLTELRRAAVSNGYEEGYRAGREDRYNGERRDFRDEYAYRQATAGYRDEYGRLDTYRRHFRQGFQRGYSDGYQNRDSRQGRGGIGEILGGVLGRP